MASMTDTTYFLSRILPDDGVRFLAERYVNLKGEEKFKHYPFMTNDEMAAFVEQCNDERRTIYHACATFQKVEYRTLESGFTYAVGRRSNNVLEVKSLWEDIDVRKTTVPSYDSQREAAAALMVACQRIDLPFPMIISSGVGLHVYWPFSEAQTPKDWLEIAKLKSLCLHHAGLKLDPSRTEDAASILRPVGAIRTVNGSSRHVRILRDTDTFAADMMRATLNKYAEEHGLLQQQKRIQPLQIINGALTASECQKVKDALMRIDPNDYGTWVTVGMCMTALLPVMGDEARNVWLAYSGRGDELAKRKNDVQGTDPEQMLDHMQPEMGVDAAVGKLMSLARAQAVLDVRSGLAKGSLAGSVGDAWRHLLHYRHFEALRPLAAEYGLEV